MPLARRVGTTMIGLGVVVFLLGSCLLVVAGVFRVMRRHSRTRLRRLRGAARVSCRDLTSGTLPRRALVSGVTAPGPGGMLVSPAFDRQCVWFSVDITAPSGDGDRAVHSAATGHLAVSDRTGTVLVDPRLILQEVHSPLLHPRLDDGYLAPRLGGSSGPMLDDLEQAGYIPRRARAALLRRQLSVTEKVIESGSPMTVLGTPRRLRGDVVLLGRWGATSVKEPGEWVDELEEDIAGSRPMIRQFATGGLVSCAVGAALTAIGLIPG